MADYSFFFVEEANISFTNGVILDGITQGDGSHLLGEFLTISALDFTEVFVADGNGVGNGNGGNGNGNGNQDTNFADNDRNQKLDGDQTIGGVTYSSGTVIEAEYEFVVRDDSTGIEYRIIAVNVNNSNPAYATNEGIAFVGDIPPPDTPLRVISAQEGPRNTGGGAVDESEIVPICFCKGTTIATPDGQRAVETLEPGDLIVRQDGSTVALARVFQTRLPATALARNPRLLPVRISAGALGCGLPKRDLWVSRQHRMLVSSPIALRMFGTPDVLVAAIRLTDLPGVFVDESVTTVEYFHLLFEDHEVILAEGAPTESLFTGPEALRAIGPDARAELLTLFPEIAAGTEAPEPARFIPALRLQRRLIERHAKNAKHVLT